MFVLINPKCEDMRKNAFPLGLSYICAVLKQYGNIKVFDLHYSNNESEMIEYFLLNEVLFVGITVCTRSVPEVSRLATLIKQISPSTLVGIGGWHATYQGYEALQHHKEFDMAFIGEGEYSVKQLAINLLNKEIKWYTGINNIIYRNGNNEIKTGEIVPSSVKNIPLPDRTYFPSPMEMAEKFSLEVPMISIDTSRGCAGSCSFCALTLDRKRRWKCRDIEQVYLELKNIFDTYQYSVVDLYLVDADFLASSKRALKLIRTFKQFPQIRYFTIAVCANSLLRAEYLLDELFEAGCRTVEIGIESGSETQLKRYNKRSTAEQNYRALELLQKYDKKYNVLLNVDLVMFDPYVTRKELLDTVKLINHFYYGDNGKESGFFSYVQLFPGTALREKAIADNLACQNPDTQIPSWSFQSEDSSNIYKYVKIYECLIYRPLCNIRKKTEGILKYTDKYFDNLKRKLEFLKDYRFLNTITYDFMLFVLQEENSVELTRKLESIHQSIKNIEQKYQNFEK